MRALASIPEASIVRAELLDGKSVADLAFKYGVKTSTLYSFLRDAGIRVPDSRVLFAKKLKSYRDFGLTYADIGSIFKLSEFGVIYILKRHGLYKRERMTGKRLWNMID